MGQTLDCFGKGTEFTQSHRMVVQYCKTYTGRADGETGFTDRTNGTVREDIYGS